MGQLSKLKQTMSNTAKNIIHSKLVMNIMIVICLLNLIGYIMMRRYTAIILGLLAGGIITRFSKNKTIIMMATLFIVNFFITGCIYDFNNPHLHLVDIVFYDFYCNLIEYIPLFYSYYI